MKIINKMLKICFTVLFLASIPVFAENKTPDKSSSNQEASAYYEKGKKLYDEKNFKEAFPLLLKAAEMGHSDAQMHVGKMYYNGWGVGHSHEKGKEWHQKAAKQGNKESIQKLYNMEHHTGSAH